MNSIRRFSGIACIILFGIFALSCADEPRRRPRRRPVVVDAPPPPPPRRVATVDEVTYQQPAVDYAEEETQAQPPRGRRGAGGPPGGARAGGRGQQMSPQARAQQLKASLGLTDAQTAKVQAAYEKNRKRMMAMRGKSLTEEERQAKMRENMRQVMQDLRPVLTPAQLAQMRQEMQSRRGVQTTAQRSGGPARSAPPGDDYGDSVEVMDTDDE